jgi:RecA-family ATPase
MASTEIYIPDIDKAIWGSNRSRASLNWKHQRFSGNVFYHFDYYQGLHDIDIFRRVTDLNTENAYFNETAYEQFAYLLHKPQVLVNFDINSNNRIGNASRF